MKRMPTLNGAPAATHRAPLDATILACLWVIKSFLLVVFGLAWLGDPWGQQLPATNYLLFGLIGIRMANLAGLYYMLLGGVGIVGAYGLFLRRPYGWWLLMLEGVDFILGASRGDGWPGGWFGMLAMLGTWGIVRLHVYDPFSVFRRRSRHVSGEHQETPASGESSPAKRKCPWDAKAMGVIQMILSSVFFILSIGYVAEPKVELPFAHVIIFGMVSTRSSLLAGINYLTTTGLGILAGYGLIKLRPYGWWLLVISLVDGTLIGLRTPQWATPLGVSLLVLTFAWAIFRAKLYKPFSWRRQSARPRG